MNEQALNISTGRKYWIDVLRALGIILVVLGHVSKEPNTVIFIYAFHMPLFFLLSVSCLIGIVMICVPSSFAGLKNCCYLMHSFIC